MLAFVAYIRHLGRDVVKEVSHRVVVFMNWHCQRQRWILQQAMPFT